MPREVVSIRYPQKILRVWGHPMLVTIMPIRGIVRTLAPPFPLFSAFCNVLSGFRFSGEGPIAFPHAPRIESLISKIRPTGLI